MLQRTIIICFTILLAGSLSACNSGQDTPHKLSDSEVRAISILGDSALFRGHDIGKHIDSMLKADRDFLFKRRMDALYYSIPFSRTDSAYFDITYTFASKELYDIQVDILLNNASDKDSLFAALNTALRERIGTPAELQGYAHWEIERNRKHIEIFLRDASDEHKRPYLTLQFTEPQIFTH